MAKFNIHNSLSFDQLKGPVLFWNIGLWLYCTEVHLARVLGTVSAFTYILNHHPCDNEIKNPAQFFKVLFIATSPTSELSTC